MTREGKKKPSQVIHQRRTQQGMRASTPLLSYDNAVLSIPSHLKAIYFFFSQNKEKLIRDGEKKIEKVGMGTGVKKISPLLPTCEDGLTGLTDAMHLFLGLSGLTTASPTLPSFLHPYPFSPLPLFHFEKLAWIGWVSVNVPAGLFGGCEIRVAVHWIGSAREIWQ
jgi:hypothetical protein